MKKLILFDIDGTLLLTGGAGKMAFNRVFRDFYQIETAWQDIRPDGRTDPDLIRQLFQDNFGRYPSHEEYLRVVQSYSDAMGKTLYECVSFRLMPGVTDLLTLLSKRNLGLIGLATGNLEVTAHLKLQRAGIRDFFSFGGFGSDSHDRLQLTRLAVDRGRQAMGKWVEPEDILLVGDTVHDIRCGKQLGLTTIAVATGSTSPEELNSVRPDHLINSLVPVGEVALMFE